MFRQLVDDSLSRMTEACPLIEHLILSSCLSIGIDGLSSLRCLHKLTLLDLSYTFLISLKPVFDSCPQLKVGLIVILFRPTYIADLGM
jgi:F-box/leucine-rich repeat protein 2/20